MSRQPVAGYHGHRADGKDWTEVLAWPLRSDGGLEHSGRGWPDTRGVTPGPGGRWGGGAGSRGGLRGQSAQGGVERRPGLEGESCQAGQVPARHCLPSPRVNTCGPLTTTPPAQACCAGEDPPVLPGRGPSPAKPAHRRRQVPAGPTRRHPQLCPLKSPAEHAVPPGGGPPLTAEGPAGCSESQALHRGPGMGGPGGGDRWVPAKPRRGHRGRQSG